MPRSLTFQSSDNIIISHRCVDGTMKEKNQSNNVQELEKYFPERQSLKVTAKTKICVNINVS